MSQIFHTSSAVASGLAIGNFLYQALQREPSWSTALERSYFQLVALLLLAALMHFRSPA